MIAWSTWRRANVNFIHRILKGCLRLHSCCDIRCEARLNLRGAFFEYIHRHSRICCSFPSCIHSRFHALFWCSARIDNSH